MKAEQSHPDFLLHYERHVRLALLVLLILTVSGATYSIAVSSIAMSIAIVLWVALLVLSRGARFTPTPLDYFFLAYCVAELLATLFSIDRATSFYNMKRLFLMSVVYLTVLSINDEKKFGWTLLAILGSASLLSMYESIVLLRGNVTDDRLAIFQHYMTAGGIKMFIVLLLLSVVIEKTAPGSWRLLALAGFLPALFALLLTQTRSSWLGFLAGAILLGFLRSRVLLGGIAIMLIVFFLFAPTEFQDRALSIFDPTLHSNMTRIQMVKTGWEIFKDYPIFGTGDIGLREIYVTYTEPIDDAEGGHLHNNIMMILVTLGITGFGAVMAMFVKIAHVEWKAYHASRHHWLYGSIAAGCLAAYLGFHVNGLFEWNFGDHEIAVLLWFTVGLAIVSEQRAQDGNKR